MLKSQFRPFPGLNRKRFLTVAGTSAVAAVVSQPFFRLEALGAPLTRYDVGGLTAASKTMKSYAKAIAAMKLLSKNDPTSWTYQGAIHWTTLKPKKTSWDTCQHGSDFFWSWHRMYLYWFERIVRKQSGDSTWTLPFWAWDSSTERHLPPMFRDGTTLAALHTTHRDPNYNNGTASLPGWAVDLSTAFGTPVYSSANALFQTPHGNVHTQVNGWMHNVNTSARDPIFYLHHANCDRLWQVWRASYGGSDPVSDSTWTGKTYTFFDENGKAVTMSACDIVNAAQQLNYVYEGVPSLAQEQCPSKFVCCIPVREKFQLTMPPIPPLTAQAVHIPLPIPPELRRRLTNIAPSSTQTIYLQLEGVEAATQPGAVWQVFVGPANPAAAPVVNTPAENSPHFVGSFSLFGLGVRDDMTGMYFRPATIALKINRALLASPGQTPLAITFVAQGPLINGQPSRPQVHSAVHISSISIVVETVKRQG